MSKIEFKNFLHLQKKNFALRGGINKQSRMHSLPKFEHSKRREIRTSKAILHQHESGIKNSLRKNLIISIRKHDKLYINLQNFGKKRKKQKRATYHVEKHTVKFSPFFQKQSQKMNIYQRNSTKNFRKFTYFKVGPSNTYAT